LEIVAVEGLTITAVTVMAVPPGLELLPPMRSVTVSHETKHRTRRIILKLEKGFSLLIIKLLCGQAVL
jgi:hypothetical protein